jgi:hypothetical protein
MSLILSDFFQGTADLKEVVPGIGASVSLDELNGSAITAKKQICDILPVAIYNAIKAGDDAEKKQALSAALANLTMAKQIPFDAIKFRKSSVAFYKNEQEASRRMYMENYYNSMDTLLSLIQDTDEWKATAFYTRSQNLKIASMSEFDALYPIDQSFLFFFRTISIQEEIIDEDLSSYFEQAAEKETETKRLKRALAMMVVASAINRFDPIELPATIRSLFDDSSISRSGEGEQKYLLEVAEKVLKKARSIIESVDMILNIQELDTSVSTGNTSACRKDKFFFMP